jgi:hypothetical protein
MSDVNVTFAAKDEGLAAAFDRVRKEAAGIKAGFAQAVGAVAAVTAAFAGLKVAVDAVKNFANFAGEISDLQAKTGLAIEPLLVLKQAFENAGISGEGLATATRKLQQNLVNASEDSGTAQKAFTDLGINFADIINLPVDQQIEIVGKAINGLEGDAKQTTAAMAIFGKSGADLLAVFKDATAIETARTQVGELATNLGTSIGALDKLSDAIQASEKNKGFQFLAGFAKSFYGDIEKAADKLNSIDLSKFGESMGNTAKGAQILNDGAVGTAIGFGATLGKMILMGSPLGAGVRDLGLMQAYLEATGKEANKVEAETTAIAAAAAAAAAEASKVVVATEEIKVAAAGSSEMWDKGVEGIRDSVSLTEKFNLSLTPAVDSVSDIGQNFFDAATQVEGLSAELQASLNLSKLQADIAEQEAKSRDDSVEAAKKLKVELLKQEIASQKENLSTAQTAQAAASEQLSTIAGATASARDRAQENRPIKAGGIGPRATRIQAAQTAARLSKQAEEARAFGDDKKAASLEKKASEARKKAFGEGGPPEGDDKLVKLNKTVDAIKVIIDTLEKKLPTNSLVP